MESKQATESAPEAASVSNDNPGPSEGAVSKKLRSRPKYCECKECELYVCNPPPGQDWRCTCRLPPGSSVITTCCHRKRHKVRLPPPTPFNDQPPSPELCRHQYCIAERKRLRELEKKTVGMPWASGLYKYHPVDKRDRMGTKYRSASRGESKSRSKESDRRGKRKINQVLTESDKLMLFFKIVCLAFEYSDEKHEKMKLDEMKENKSTADAVTQHRSKEGRRVVTPVASISPRTVASNSPRTVTSNSPRTVASNTPRTVASNSPRTVASNTPRTVASNSPRTMASNTPRTVASNSPRTITSNTPKTVTSNSPRTVASNSPRPMSSNSPRTIASNSPRPVSSNSPRPVSSNSPGTVASNSPRTATSNSPRPMASNSPRTVGSKSPRSAASNSPQPASSNSPRPIASTKSRSPAEQSGKESENVEQEEEEIR